MKYEHCFELTALPPCRLYPAPRPSIRILKSKPRNWKELRFPFSHIAFCQLVWGEGNLHKPTTVAGRWSVSVRVDNDKSGPGPYDRGPSHSQQREKSEKNKNINNIAEGTLFFAKI